MQFPMNCLLSKGEWDVLHITAMPDTLRGMCRAVTCTKCGKASWAGCGAHVEQVLGGVLMSDRCQCRTVGSVTAKKSAQSSSARKGVFARLFGKE